MNIIKNFFYPNKNDILDPLSLVIKLYIYSFTPDKTKISILNNKIEFQEDGIFQSTVRTINRDTKNDLINMLLPLTYACEMYLNDNNDSSKYNIIFEGVICSLNKLNKVYESNEITQNIEQLKNIVQKFLNGHNFSPTSIVSNWNEPSTQLKKSFYSQTNSIWTQNRLKILFGYINEITITKSIENTTILIISLKTFMNYIDLLVSNLINDLHLLR